MMAHTWGMEEGNNWNGSDVSGGVDDGMNGV